MKRALRLLAHLQKGAATIDQLSDACEVDVRHVMDVLQPYVDAKMLIKEWIKNPKVPKRSIILLRLAGIPITDPVQAPRARRSGTGIITPSSYAKRIAHEHMKGTE